MGNDQGSMKFCACIKGGGCTNILEIRDRNVISKPPLRALIVSIFCCLRCILVEISKKPSIFHEGFQTNKSKPTTLAQHQRLVDGHLEGAVLVLLAQGGSVCVWVQFCANYPQASSIFVLKRRQKILIFRMHQP